MTTPPSDLTEAEAQVIEAAQSGQFCNLASDVHLDSTPATADGTRRPIRAALLSLLLSDTYPGIKVQRVSLKGAAIVGELRLEGAQIVSTQLTDCRVERALFGKSKFTGAAVFNRTEFSGTSIFSNATFVLNAQFKGCTFANSAVFDNAVFNAAADFTRAKFFALADFNNVEFGGKADFSRSLLNESSIFNDARFKTISDFNDASFLGTANFKNSTFEGTSRFKNVTFASSASFFESIFKKDCRFNETLFANGAGFSSATFTGTAGFNKSRFIHKAWFKDARFLSDARFNYSVFSDEAIFRRAVFTGAVSFQEAYAKDWNLRGSELSSEIDGLAGDSINLDQVSITSRTDITLLAEQVSCVRLIARGGVHAKIRALRVDMSDADFSQSSIVEGVSELKFTIPDAIPIDPKLSDEVKSIRQSAHYRIHTRASNFDQEIASPKNTKILSLERSDVSGLSISDVDMTQCTFSGAHGLDKLRIGYGCIFQRVPDREKYSRIFRRSERNIIAEELLWRRAHSRGWGPTPADDTKIPDGIRVASIYRELRKGFEDAKNAPGAADFYYGEMEMRRIASRGRKSKDGQSSILGKQSLIERSLLSMYWAISGYGLRASRAIICLFILLLVSAILFTLPTFATIVPLPERAIAVDMTNGQFLFVAESTGRQTASLAQAFRFVAQEGVSLLRPVGTSALRTTGPGTVLDYIIRLASPVLLALAVLAVRGRTRR
ncbi:pentapeptide repeat-containing protein [Rhodococcus sp. USK13]|uniref:pentapeptide repeat-containing protein n=1 Tax=Rhodococcus sp. USK13 TaxID=2806442 RepID=UPI0020165FA2|nr:pentapeptide repeat-containing protein [Rhodococcus sp. USK13]